MSRLVTSFRVSGMTCAGCVSTVRKALTGHPHVLDAEVTLDPAIATITSAAPMTVNDLNTALSGTHYQLLENVAVGTEPSEGSRKTWLATYYPLLLVFAYITVVAVLTSVVYWGIHLES